MQTKPTHPPPLPLRIVTLNIRYATSSPFKGELPWPQRRPHLLSALHSLSRPHFAPLATVICLQEVLHTQLIDILASFNATSPASSPEWSYIGVGRDDGKEAGEYAPILFRPAVFSVLHSSTTWLSPTPNVPGSKFPDAGSPRILNLAVLLHRESGRKILALNTHLDDQSAIARREAAKMIVRIAARVVSASGWEIDFSFLAGDLNSEPSGDAYEILNLQGSLFVDISRCIGEEDATRRYGNEMTFTGFKDDGDGEGMKRIDFIHLGTNNYGRNLVVEGYAVLPNKLDDGVYLSDHRPVVGDVVLTSVEH